MEFKLPELNELSFDEEKHVYTLGTKKLPSVTQIMDPLSKAKYGGITQKVLEAAAFRGTAIHNSIENYIDFGIIDIDEEYKGYFNGFLKWNSDAHPEFFASEFRLYHKLFQYAGTLDILAKIGTDIVLIDAKNTAQVVEMTCGVQLEAYAQALKSHDIAIDKKLILQLKPDGTYCEFWFPKADAARWKVFTALKTVYDYIQSN